jgi:hypothetical protein
MKFQSSKGTRGGRYERGTGLLEAAVWIVPLATLFMMGFALAGYYHDFGAMKGIFESMLRESWGKPQRIVFTDPGKSIIVAHDGLHNALVRVIGQAEQEAANNLFRIDGFSARACYWVFEVDSSSGRLTRQLQEHCKESGSNAGRVDFTSLLKQQAGRAVGIPLHDVQSSGSGATEYFGQVVIVGAGVTGDYTGLGIYEQNRRMTFADVSFPRQELTL